MIKKLLAKFHSDSTQGKIIRNVFWAVLGKVVTLLSTLIVGILVARYLGPEQYGLMNYAISVVALFGIFSTFGTTEIIIRELSKGDLPKEIILGTSFFTRLVLAVITLCLIGIYLLLFNESTETSVLILIYSISSIFSCFDVIRFYFTSIIQNEYIVKSEMVRSLIGAGIKIVLLLLNAPLYAFVMALTFDFFLLASGYIVAYKKKVARISEWKFDYGFAKSLLKTSLPILISSAAVIIYQRIDQVMIGRMLDNESLGYFSTAASFIGIVTFIPTIMIQTISPILVKYKKENINRYQSESQRMMNITTWSTMIICIILSALSYYIIRYTYGIEYLAAVPVMQVLVFKAVGIALTTMGGQLIIIENIHQVAFIRNIIACFVCVICNYILIPRWGIIGSAWATIITVMFTGGIANIFIPRYHHIFKMQCKSLFMGWKDVAQIRQIFVSR
ncbi:flippase [uncultured Coprobacter sp.]|uniref:flippase n=1 Tax=uncultured Coprobacter sp. TaxID=1720550 RepID=UPI002638E0CB|nr:flippase [uncultured Coprobacter sp.]